MEKESTKPKYSMHQNIIYILRNMWHWNKKLFFMSAARVPLLVILPFLGILMPKLVIDSLTNKSGPLHLTIVIGLVTLGMVLCSTFSEYLDRRITRVATSNRMHYLILIYEKIMDTDYENLENPKGQKMQEKAMYAVHNNSCGPEAIIKAMILLASNFFGILLYGSILANLNPLIILFIIATSALSFLESRRAQNYEHNKKDSWAYLDKKLDYLLNKCSDYASGKDIRLYNMTGWFEKMFSILLGDRVKWYKKVEKHNYVSNTVDGFMTLIRDGLAYAYLIYLVLSGKISAANFILYFGMVAGFSIWLSGITDELMQINHMSLEICDIRNYLELPDRFNRGSGTQFPAKKEWPCAVEFEHVTFKYPGSDNKILDDFNLKINRGEKIALVGINGAGKTTCIKLLCGFYHPTSGHILVNGKDMTSYNRDDYCRLFTAVFQDIHVLPVSIEQNIAPVEEENIDKQKVMKCIALAGLDAKVKSLKDGVDSLMVKEVNDGAVQLSGGEMQKLLLARALYKESPILILDEPTAALDPIAENELYQKYGKLTSGKTSIFISHRLSSTRFCDRIVFLSDGKITECGTHDELMMLNGKYAHMYEIQSHYYKDNVDMQEVG